LALATMLGIAASALTPGFLIIPQPGASYGTRSGGMEARFQLISQDEAVSAMRSCELSPSRIHDSAAQ
jgi:hypothetical protein